MMSLTPGEIDFKETWEELKEAIQRVLSLQSTERAVWRHCFSLVYSLCVAQPEPYDEHIYVKTWYVVDEYVGMLAQRVLGADHDPSAEDVSPDPEDGLLARYADAWYDFMKGAADLNNMFAYFNQHYVFKDKVEGTIFPYDSAMDEETGVVILRDVGYLEIVEVCVFSWYRLMLQPLGPRLGLRVTLALRRYRSDLPPRDSRRGRMLNAVILSAMRVYADRPEPLALYHEMILEPYLRAAEIDHADAAKEASRDSDISYYMKHTQESLHRELRLAETFLHESSLHAVRHCFESTAILPHMASIHAYADSLLQADKAVERREDLRRMYTLLLPLGEEHMLPLRKFVEAQVAREGTAAMQRVLKENDPVLFVESILALRRKYTRLFTDVFDGDWAIFAAIDRGSMVCVNVRSDPQSQPRAPELLARYMDSMLRKRAAAAGDGNDGQTEAEIEERLAASMDVFKFVADKDFFRKYYTRGLAKRLLRQSFATMEREEAMIERLRAACGFDYTGNLRRMFTDMTLSADVNAEFQEHARKGDAADAESAMRFCVQVLQASAWPLAGAHEAQDGERPPPLPLSLERPVCLFEQFYRSAFNGRKLVWLQHLFTGELRTRYTRRHYNITATVAQCAILLSFDTAEQWNASDLRESLQLPQETWLRTVRPVIDSGLLLLLSDGQPSLEDAKLRLNHAFVSKRARVRLTIALPPTAEGAQPKSVISASACDGDRKLFLQAAIVRIMKNRKVCTHNDLLVEVNEAARDKFMPPFALVEKCIHALIEKEYLESASDDPHTYKYLA